jgi:hypothetical protein
MHTISLLINKKPRRLTRFFILVSIAGLLGSNVLHAQRQSTDQAVASPYTITKSLLQRTIRYRLAHKNGEALVLPSTGEQRILPARTKRLRSETVIEICQTCGDESRPSAAELQAALMPNSWTDSSDSGIVAFAQNARVNPLPAYRDFFADDPELIERRMNRLSAEVTFHFTDTTKNVPQNASEALRSKRGDCSEMALLLAAAAKTRNIPARVVIGLAYSPNFKGKKQVFAPHVWMQAWNGQRWQSFDAALYEFNSTHIALAITNGDPKSVTHVPATRRALQIKAAGVVPKN